MSFYFSRKPRRNKQNLAWGLCSRCGGKPRPGRKTCELCAAKSAIAVEKYRAKKEAQ